MREILFRGKRVYNGEWVEGDFINVGESCIVIWDEELGDYDYISVLPETVGQYTGKMDKNEMDIFEGDLLKICGRILTVEFDNGAFICADWPDRYNIGIWGTEGIEIIGNIHDNPELLNATGATTGITHMNTNQLDPKEGQEEVKEETQEQATEATQETTSEPAGETDAKEAE